MEIFTKIPATRAQVADWRRAGQRIALVPTMGALHDGHLSLVAQALSCADRVIVSLFVNPLQFGPNEDFDRYPRTFERDCELLNARGVHALFAPADAQMYPDGREGQTRVHVPGLSDMLCGLSRPGFFDGVATVVTKLFNAVQPDIAIFGEKDFQQLVVIRRLVRDLNLPIEILSGPTVREVDGLALSSRNAYLSDAERVAAPALYRQLQQAAQALRDGCSPAAAEAEGERALNAVGFNTDYFSVRRAHDLGAAQPCDAALVILVAAYLGSTRLIDNLLLQRPAART
ncbi:MULTISPECIES: pantoate--beta-alanine ligase [Thiorhodovibrio]|uniref:pantoate--beta-alanine ligase n=1 Tax=Thiorhodovibrio TaxID=61593 RepID=UPI0019144401|nr:MULTISPECIES: pantoate--beta-alanine ligase [Thiorhodovibrio]MBK5971006.1 pantoate--beta-alanine ligase [Thiorhodovibrio winogradskyi]WPL10628.1 Pantothenate synthetase [Thiorhodovibrio litoralis]